MRLKLLLLWPGAALLWGTCAQANLAFELTPAAQSGVGSNEVVFAAAMTNASLTDNLYLNDILLSLIGQATNSLAPDTNIFFANVPGILLTGETYTDIVFGVMLNPGTPPGDYSGTVTIRGGLDIFATNNLASQTFHVMLTAPAQLRIVTEDGRFGVQANGFGFNVSGPSNEVVVVEASTNLATPAWWPLQTNTLGAGPLYFNDPTWTNYPGRFYRARAQ